MKKIKQTATRALSVTAIGLALVFTGCSTDKDAAMNSTKARDQLDIAVEAVQSATGEDWVLEVAPGPIGCSTPGLEHLTTSWQATATVDRDAAYTAVREALEGVGLETRILGPDSKTPTVASQTGDGFGLDFAYPIEGGPVYLHIGSDCFPWRSGRATNRTTPGPDTAHTTKEISPPAGASEPSAPAQREISSVTCDVRRAPRVYSDRRRSCAMPPSTSMNVPVVEPAAGETR